MTTNDAALREKFEAFCKRNGLSLSWGTTTYFQQETHNAWLAFQFAWQASAEEERGRIEECAKMLDMRANISFETFDFRAAMREAAYQVRALNRTDPNLVRAQHPDGVPCSCEQCTARRLAAQQEKPE
jgi:hypothetical protein